MKNRARRGWTFGDPDARPMHEVKRLLEAAGFTVERTFGRGRTFTVNARR